MTTPTEKRAELEAQAREYSERERRLGNSVYCSGLKEGFIQGYQSCEAKLLPDIERLRSALEEIANSLIDCSWIDKSNLACLVRNPGGEKA